MAGITLAVAEEKLQLWLDADTAVAKNQEFWVEGRRVTRADARTIKRNIEFWDAKVRALTGGRRRVRYVGSIG